MKQWRLKNTSKWDTRTVRRILTHAFNSVKTRSDRRPFKVSQWWNVHVRGSTKAHISGRASYGGGRMIITVPNPETNYPIEKLTNYLAWVARHEALHWAGFMHADMSSTDMWERHKRPSWLPDGLLLMGKQAATPKPHDPLAYAQAKLEAATDKMTEWLAKTKRAQNRVAAWRKKVRYYQKRVQKLEGEE